MFLRLERDLYTRKDQFGVEIRERAKWDIRESMVGTETFQVTKSQKANYTVVINRVFHGFILISKMIFESILTTFKSYIVFKGSWGSSVNWLEPKIEPPYPNLAFPNP